MASGEIQLPGAARRRRIHLGKLIAFFVALILSVTAAFAQQAPSTVTNMPFASTPLSGNELLYVVQTGNPRKTTVASLSFSAINNLLTTSQTVSGNWTFTGNNVHTGTETFNGPVTFAGPTNISFVGITHTATYGSICDGQSHMLSTVTSFGGQNSTGWTAAQWSQAIPGYPSTLDPSTQELDGWAITATWASIRTVTKLQTVMKIDGSKCRSTWSIDHTGIKFLKNLVIDWSGVELDCAAVGQACVDMTDTFAVKLEQLYVVGDPVNVPKVGLLMARVTSPGVTGNLVIDHFSGDGSYTLGAIYNMATEVNWFTHPTISNQDLNGGMAMINDAANHFNVASFQQFVKSTTLAVDHGSSFTQNTVTSGFFACKSCLAPMWISGVRQWEFQNPYINNNKSTTPKYSWMFYEEQSSPILGLSITGRSEAYGVANAYNEANTFYITGDGSTATANIASLHYQDAANWASVSVIGVDPAVITKVVLNDFKLGIDQFAVTNVPLVDNAAIYNINGYVALPLATNFPLDLGFMSGTVCFQSECYPITPLQPLNRDSEIGLYDTLWGHQVIPATASNGTPVGDGWVKYTNGTTNPATFQALQGNFCESSSYGEQVVVTNAQTMGANAVVAMRSFLPATELNGNWGNANFPVLTVHVRIGGYNGTASAFFTNAAGTTTYVQELTVAITTTPACQDFVFQVPYTANGLSSFNQGQNGVGLIFGITFDCGTGIPRLPAAGVWTNTTASTAFCGPNTSHFMGTNGTTANVLVERIYSSNILPTYQQWSDGRSVYENARFAQKSVPNDVFSADGTYQNLGSQGAQIFSAPGNGASVTGTVTFSAPMWGIAATEPTILTASTSSASTHAWDTTAAKDCGAIAINAVSNNGFSYSVTPPVSVAANDVCRFNWTAQVSQ